MPSDDPALALASAPPGQRLYALDNLRAAMMWLGIVLHVAVIHLAGRDSPLPWRDDRTTPLANLLTAFIHAFRMPVFFILAGFFVALLVASRGVRGMLGNRLRRLALPFAVFWPPLFAACVVLALLFVHRMARGTWGLDPALMQRPGVRQGPATMHLWFLWMLLWFSLLTAPALRLAQHLPAAVTGAIERLFLRLGGAAWGFAVLSLPLAWAGSRYANGIVAPDGAFLPPLAEWVHNGLFYVFGWHLFRHRDALFAQYARRWPLYALAGLPFFLASGALVALLERGAAPTLHLPLGIAFVYNCASWLWSFALIGLFLRHLQRPHALLGYLAESAYWVYLVHMPLTIGFGALLFGTPLPVGAKMALNIAATTAICLASYHLCVRFSGLGLLLNGRRHVRRPPGGRLTLT